MAGIADWRVDTSARRRPAGLNADALLARLEGVRQTGEGRWTAKCPAHADRHPSLSIRELSDGRILLHDFAGCDVGSVLNVIGLNLSDLFPDRLHNAAHDGGSFAPERRPFSASDALRCVSHEALIVLLCASDLSRGELTDDAHERLAVAVGRIRDAWERVR